MSEFSASDRAYRIGIDVGGTFTKAVLIDNATHEVVGRFSVLADRDGHIGPIHLLKGHVEERLRGFIRRVVLAVLHYANHRKPLAPTVHAAKSPWITGDYIRRGFLNLNCLF